MNASGPSASEFCVYIDDIAVFADCRWTKISFNLTRGLALSDKPFNKRLCCIKAAARRSRVFYCFRAAFELKSKSSINIVCLL
jgi:hypothetical protein